MRRVLSNSAASVLGKTLGLAVQVALIALLVRSFGVDAYGLLVLALGLVGNANLLEGAFGRYATKEIAGCLAQGDRAGVAEVVTVNLGLAGAQIVGFALVFLAIEQLWLETIFTIPSALIGSAHRVVRIFVVVMALDLLVISLLRIGEGFQDHVRTKAIESAKHVTRFVLVAGVVAAGGTIEAIAAAYVAASVLALCVAAFWLRRRGELPLALERVSWRRIAETGRFSAIMVLQKVTGFVANRADVFIVGHVLGTAGLTYYQIAFKFYEVFGEFVSTLTYAFMPHVAELSARGKRLRIGQLFARSSKYVLILVAPAICVTALVSGWLLEAWVGPTGRGAGSAALAYLGAALLLAIPGAGSNILLGLGSLRNLVLWSAIGSVLSVAGSLLLIGRLGVLGPALGTLAGSAVTGVAVHLVCARHLVPCPWSFTRRVALRYVAPALVAFGLSALAARGGIGSMAAAGVVIVAIALAWWLDTESRDDVRRLLAAVGAGAGRRFVRIAG